MDEGPQTGTTRLTASANEAGLRLDLFVAAHLPTLSRSQIQRLIKIGHVQLDGKPGKASWPMSVGAQVDLTLPAAEDPRPRPEDLPLRIVLDDSDITVVDNRREWSNILPRATEPAPSSTRCSITSAD